MSHIRQQQREAARTMLLGSPQAGSRVYIGRVKPVEKGAGISIGIYTSSETAREITMDAKQSRITTLKIDAAGNGDEADLLADLDDLAIFVEQAFAADPLLGGAASTSEYKGATFASSMEGEKPFMVMTITYELTAFTQNSDPETILT